MIIHILLLYFLVIAIWWLYVFAHKDFMIDKTRQRLFETRDMLFDHAMEGRISFDDDAYPLVRDTLNGMIRFTHNISLIRFFIISFVCKDIDRALSNKYAKELKSAFEKLSKEKQEIYKTILSEAHLIVVVHLISTSLILFIIFGIPRTIMAVFRKLRHLHDNYSSSITAKSLLPNDNELWNKIDARANYIAHHY